MLMMKVVLECLSLRPTVTVSPECDCKLHGQFISSITGVVEVRRGREEWMKINEVMY